MTQDEISELARKAGLFGTFVNFKDEIEAFAKLVAEKATEEANARANASWTLMCEKMVAFEREACAKVCESHGTWDNTETIAKAIRAGGQQ